MKKKFLSIGILLIFIISCSDTGNSYEVEMATDEINWPFEDIDSGKFGVLYRNSSINDLRILLVYFGQQIIFDKDQKDFCPQMELIKSGVVPEGILVINDLNLEQEQNVPNQNDHPNFVSYSLPKGSYVVFADKFDTCNKDSYITFDVNTMDAFNLIKE